MMKEMSDYERWIETITRPKNILLVEDDDGTRLVMRQFMKWYNCNLIEASRGREAVEILSRPDSKIDFVFLDLRMPDMSGEQVFEILREDPLKTKWPNLPVVVISGFIDMNIVERMRLKGFCCFISKPQMMNRQFIADLLGMFGINRRMPAADVEGCEPGN